MAARIIAIDVATRQISVLADKFEGKPFTRPNDLVVADRAADRDPRVSDGEQRIGVDVRLRPEQPDVRRQVSNRFADRECDAQGHDGMW